MFYKFLYLLFAITFLFDLGAFAQTARNFGLRDKTPEVFAFINATLVKAPGDVTEDAVMVIRDGRIESAGRRAEIPADAHIVDLEGKMIYPGFIDAYAHYGISEPEKDYEPHHWNPQIRADYSSAAHFKPDEEQAGMLRSQGFVAAHTLPGHGLMRGYGSVVSTGEGKPRYHIIRSDISQHMSFEASDLFDSRYPTSSMGSIALLRQSLLDAAWYEKAQSAYRAGETTDRPETNLSLEALSISREYQTPFIIPADNENWFLRANAIAEEFSLPLWVRGSGHEYRRLDAIRATGLPVILPLDFPDAPDVSTPEASVNVSLEALRHWYLAPENPANVIASGLKTALTSHGSEKDFLDNLRMATDRGLDKDDALAALTTTPAEMLGIDQQYGTLEAGKRASFIIASGDVFEESEKIQQVWIEGKRYDVEVEKENPAGKWSVAMRGQPEETSLTIEGHNQHLRGQISSGDHTVSLKQIRYDDTRLTLSFDGDSLGMHGLVRLSANITGDQMLGLGESASEAVFTWSATREESQEKDQKQRHASPGLDLPERYPSMEYGISEIPPQPAHLVVRNATIWTQGPEGVLENADMLVSHGKVEEVGYDIDAPRRAVEIDAEGLHLTPGLIDPHIHTSISGGVNETGDAITSETRITDVMHGDNVWLYRLLAGGITSASLLHGSANPIGGQNAVFKPRWGQLGEDMLIEDASPGLKFALGENVKRLAERYPSSRQGVEQIIKDAFQAALEYGKEWEKWEESQTGPPPRRDLQLEAILEVIEGERKAHVHAYRQDEMLMMMRLAEAYGFTIRSFEHTLEGYKIADELREHGAGAVVWTDWSSFKVEAYDGILHNARLLNEAGVLTSLHSDNTQLATRMNWEAAKVMMTGVDEVEALDLITMRPAKILGIDHRTGSLEPGKDADFVLWNGHPMSTFTVAEQTWLEGRKYFDREEDQNRREQVSQERAMIISAILELQNSSRKQQENNDSRQK